MLLTAKFLSVVEGKAADKYLELLRGMGYEITRVK